MAVDDIEEKPAWWERFYNEEKGTLLGRTLLGWCLLAVFYFCFFAFLAGFFVILWAIFLETIHTTDPKWYGEDSMTQDNPGIGLRPMPMYDSTLIRFQQGKPSSYKPYTDHLEAYLLQYEPKLVQGRDLRDCSVSVGFTKDNTVACKVDLDEFLKNSGCTKEKDFGYEDGTPCVLLKMNKIYGFIPEPYESLDQLLKDNGLTVAPRFLAFTPNLTVGIACEGETAADRENLIDIKYHPSERWQGIPKIFYPYQNQEGYRSPFVMVQFTKFNKRVVIQITCTLYAKNIDNSGTAQRHGTIRFELLKD